MGVEERMGMAQWNNLLKIPLLPAEMVLRVAHSGREHGTKPRLLMLIVISRDLSGISQRGEDLCIQTFSGPGSLLLRQSAETRKKALLPFPFFCLEP